MINSLFSKILNLLLNNIGQFSNYLQYSRPVKPNPKPNFKNIRPDMILEGMPGPLSVPIDQADVFLFLAGMLMAYLIWKKKFKTQAQ